jgi:hypothetical protein
LFPKFSRAKAETMVGEVFGSLPVNDRDGAWKDDEIKLLADLFESGASRMSCQCFVSKHTQDLHVEENYLTPCVYRLVYLSGLCPIGGVCSHSTLQPHRDATVSRSNESVAPGSHNSRHVVSISAKTFASGLVWGQIWLVFRKELRIDPPAGS